LARVFRGRLGIRYKKEKEPGILIIRFFGKDNSDKENVTIANSDLFKEGHVCA
jgi:hypothetical protein